MSVYEGVDPPLGTPVAFAVAATSSKGSSMPAALSSASPAVFAFGLGPMELAIFAVVVLLLFGHRLPSVMRSLGSGIVEFKKGVKGGEEDAEEAAKVKDETKTSKP